jgi:hypothetical protein
MRPSRAIPAAALAALALSAPAAHAADDVVANPAPGVSAVALSDQQEPGRLVLHVSTPVADGHFSALVLDLDGDRDGDLVAVATKGRTGRVVVRATPGSTEACQQVDGSTAAAVPGATGTLDTGGGGWTARIPVALLPQELTWAVVAGTPAAPCGSSDDSVVGVPLSLAGARPFRLGTVQPPVDTEAPATPTGLVAAPGDGRVTLSWAAGAEPDLAGYLVYRRTGTTTGAFTLVAQTGGGTTVVDEGLTNGVTYEYYVRARDAAGNLSPESAKVTATPAAPQPPDGGDGGDDDGGDDGDDDDGTPPPPDTRPRGKRIGPCTWVRPARKADRPTFDPRTGRVVAGQVHCASAAQVAVRFATRGRRGAVVGSVREDVAAGQTVTLDFRLDAQDRRTWRSRGALPLRAVVTVRPTDGRPRLGVVRLVARADRDGRG